MRCLTISSCMRLPLLFTKSLSPNSTHIQTVIHNTGPVSVSMKAAAPPCFLSSSIMVSLGQGEAQPVDGWMERHYSFSNSPIRARQTTTETHTSTCFTRSFSHFCSFVSHPLNLCLHFYLTYKYYRFLLW